MKFFLIKISMVIPTMIPMLSNPISMGILLLTQTMIIIMLMNKILKSSWFIMITFLMMIGGLLIIFSYISSIASNEKLKVNIWMSLIMIVMLFIMDEMIIENQINESQELINMYSMEKLSLMKLYNKKSMSLTILLVMYLLLTMIIVSKIVKHHEGPLRMK